MRSEYWKNLLIHNNWLVENEIVVPKGGILSLYIGSYVVAIQDYNSNEVRTDEHYIIDETARDKGKNPSAEVVYYLWDDITRVTFKTR
jgi:hypothetical protein